MKQPLLYLCHRIPYPPNKGDKIRSFNQLVYLAKHYEIYLGCFVDDPSDMAYMRELSQYVQGMNVLPLSKRQATFRGLTSFFTGDPITLPYYFDQRMSLWVSNTLANFQIKNILVFSSSMAQYVDSPQYDMLHRVVDFVDLDSDKWRQYADNKVFPMRQVYQREYRKLLKYEQDTSANFDASVFISSLEVDLFNELSGAHSNAKVHAVGNGVDLAFFDPKVTNFDPSLRSGHPTIVFTGAMDYWANVDAVRWFVKHVWPLITKRVRNPRLMIVGGNPTDKVKELEAFDGVEVTGRVKDIRQYIQAGWVSVAPMRIARGVQNKVLEAMAMEVPVVASSLAMEGLEQPTGCDVAVADEPQEFADAVVERLQQRTTSAKNRKWVEEHYQWNAQLALLHDLLECSK
ncbi:TIGR03087 family PEP-CTERM/XrtA system glycosyltransferase [Echinimonas agarilytica]|uniref:TIGR03087 family PEP-CTERM/XrtA system glycosyltransferase n=1 Tax=Echinimonas agarilytica TaxID=1215918 RepID=A0AA42B9K3_9GAMM|nr:TIGR03087 family PEP-CTERM/XrtA system glycosyltransferase [Echinimonas agarilytica]MCM2681473.1 TIGR03087 family PEP-CTERM/XrtA system glycosyltransferase [Echinimonas agarilytica]